MRTDIKEERKIMQNPKVIKNNDIKNNVLTTDLSHIEFISIQKWVVYYGKPCIVKLVVQNTKNKFHTNYKIGDTVI